MPFGLINGPSEFQIVNEVLREFLYRSVIVYMNKTLIFSLTEKEHFHCLELVLQTHIFVKLKICEFSPVSWYIMDEQWVDLNQVQMEVVTK